MSSPGRPSSADGGSKERPPGPYVLGHSTRELDRLDLQGLLYRDVTRRAFLDAGISPGMRVLDIGSGSGDVSRLSGEIVGPGGFVLGIDRDEVAVRAARARTPAENVRFEVGEIGDAGDAGPFDALVGRFILMHQASPSDVLARAVRAVRPGGAVVMVESNMESLLGALHSWPHSDLFDRVVRWKCDVVEAAGADLRAGIKLPGTYRAAGLPGPDTRLEARVEGGAQSIVWAYMAESVRSMLPRARLFGVDTEPVDPVETLEERLREEIGSTGGVVVLWPVVSAWARVPGKPGSRAPHA